MEKGEGLRVGKGGRIRIGIRGRVKGEEKVKEWEKGRKGYGWEIGRVKGVEKGEGLGVRKWGNGYGWKNGKWKGLDWNKGKGYG